MYNQIAYTTLNITPIPAKIVIFIFTCHNPINIKNSPTKLTVLGNPIFPNVKKKKIY